MKKVSFCLPTFNREEYLAAAIDSCLGQTYKNIEIIVVDDGSTDGTDTLMNYYVKNNNNVKYFKLAKNEGISFARNYGISKSSGDFIAVMDSDDMCSPERIKKQVRAIKDNDFIWSSFLYADEGGRVNQAILAPKEFKKEDIIKNTSVPHVTILAKKSCFIKHPYRNELEANDDKALLIDWLRAKYRGIRIKEPLMIVRNHFNNISKTRQKYIDKLNGELNAELA